MRLKANGVPVLAGDEEMKASPIREVKICTLHPKYFAKVQEFMRAHGCTVVYMSRGIYVFQFPEGTEEIEYPSSHIGTTFYTTIRFPDGLKITKKVLLPQIEGGPTVTFLILPNEAYGVKLDGLGVKKHGRKFTR